MEAGVKPWLTGSFSRGRYGRELYFAPGESPGVKYGTGDG
jgi:hypothetical protein